ncbi:MAG: Arylsulfatase regulator (Fe-S oxidoreductase) [Firmicutes bacterium]|nr:Arylsulfatase regulator (Fe-S oxidoreductase) [Bacillota bacterium]
MTLNIDVHSFFAKEYPLIRLFAYGNDVLLYDAKPHFACVLSHKELDVLSDFLHDIPEDQIVVKHSSDLHPEYLRQLISKFQELKFCGTFLKGPLEEISSVDRDIIRKQVQYFDENIMLRKFCLEVTEDCNFRCTYCRNTTATEFRKHSKTNMTQALAVQSIDYYFARYTRLYAKLTAEKQALLLEIAPPTLSWYGGEPFLQFALIKKSAEYFKKLPWYNYGIDASNFVFASNTNLSIMNTEILEFLVNNNVLLFASLDGPEEEHNRCRVFENGEGTFSQAYTNLQKIKDFNETYFKEQVSIFGVYTDKHDRQKCFDFIRGLGTRDIKHFAAEYPGFFKSELDTEYEAYSQFIENDLQEFKDIIKFLTGKKDISQEMSYFDSLEKFTKINHDNPLGSNALLMLLSCPMGFDNLMLAANGDYLICHKTDGSMPIGNCALGLDFEKMVDLYQQYNETINNPDCKSCWNLRFCQTCAAPRMLAGEFKNPSQKECDFFRLQTIYDFLCFIYLSVNHGDLLQKISDNWKNNTRRSSIIDISKF